MDFTDIKTCMDVYDIKIFKLVWCKKNKIKITS